MPQQLSLMGFDATFRSTDGLFFAILPDISAAARIAQLARHLRGELGLKGEPFALERLHISLHYLGDYEGIPPGIVAAAHEAAATVAMPRFDIAFNRAMSFSGKVGNLPFVLCGDDGGAGLMMLHQRLGTAIRNAGLWRWVKPHYTPHMTLLYDADRVIGRAVETVRWTAREFVLVHSLHGRNRYVVLARWPLSG
jgi:2'-5' RNA ligase